MRSGTARAAGTGALLFFLLPEDEAEDRDELDQSNEEKEELVEPDDRLLGLD